MKIGEVAAAAAIDVETIRFYERKGLLPPPARRPNGYRAHTAAHLARLTFIRRCRSPDLGLDDVRSLIEMLEQPGIGRPRRPRERGAGTAAGASDTPREAGRLSRVLAGRAGTSH